MGIPELDLLIAFYGGNYSDPVLYVSQRVYVPECSRARGEGRGEGGRRQAMLGTLAG